MVLRGIAIDFWTQLEKLLHVDSEFVSTSSLEERRLWLEQGDIDVELWAIMGEGGDDFLYVPVGFDLKQRLFVNRSCRTVVCVRDITHKRVAVISGAQYKTGPDKVNPDNVVSVPSPLEALNMLNSGLVDVFLAPSERVALYLIEQYRLEHVKAVGLPISTIPLALAVHPGRRELYRRIQQAMVTLDRFSIPETIRKKWEGTSYRGSFWDTYLKEFLIAAAAVVIGLLAVMLWNYQLKSRVRRMTRDLETSGRRYRTLIESSPDMLFVVEQDGVISQANDKAKAFFSNLRAVDEKAVLLNDLVVPEERKAAVDFLARVFEKRISEGSFTLTDRQERVIEVDVAAVRILSEHGDRQLACCFARDVTQRNSIERELVQADRMATIGKLAAGVAHEINNPLGIMQANVQLILARGWYDESAKEPLEAIRRNAVRAGQITKDLLNLTRPGDPRPTHVDLVELVRVTLSMLHPQLKRIRVDFQPNPEEIIVYADRNLLQQVLVNILLNAKNSLEEASKKEIRIRFCAICEENAACIRIEDTGRGIPRKYLNRIFEPFFSHGKADGFGLGLFISRRIIEKHNGMIFAESEKGKGTHIIIELPLLNTA
ncbi:PAS domain S-box protein [delta proteobacterium NaphS2]|nr:PAS domain S-box protein [delta proteobacterium NaphS2]